MNSTKKILYAVFTLFILLGFYFSHSAPKKHDQTTGPNAASGDRQKAQTLLEKAKAHPGLMTAHLSAVENTPKCGPVLRAIETMPLQTLMYDLENGKLHLDAKCLFESENTIPMLKGFPQVCDARVDGKVAIDCQQKLFFYKAIRIQKGSADLSLDQLATEVLIQKFIGMLGLGNTGSVSDMKQMREIGEKIHERLPDSAPAAKAAMLGYLMAAENLTGDEKQRYDESLDDARQKFPGDWDLYEIDLIRKKIADEKNFQAEVGHYYETNPSSAIAQYYMGCVNWQHQKISEAQRFFKLAADSAPNDQRFKETYQKSLSGKSDDKVCVVTISFNPEQF